MMNTQLIETQKILLVKRSYRISKRIFDISLCLIAAPAIILLMAVIALLIFIDDPGPIIFKQMRTGKGGHRFAMYKFRTMVTNAEELKQKYAHLNELTWPDFKITNDPRVTRIGRILRKTSLDELPQFINVIKGEMSLVGPRPLPLRDYAGFEKDWHRRRLSVKPGVTGLWQVKDRDHDSFERWMKLDMLYIDQWSLWSDFKILLQTIPAVLRGSGE